MRSYAAQRSPGRSAFGFAFVIVLHAILIWGLMNGLGHKMIEVIKGPLEAKIIAAPKPPKEAEPPPPPPETVKPPPPYIPMPQINVAATDDNSNAISAPLSSAPPSKAPPPPPPAAVADTYVQPVAIGGEKPTYPESLVDDEVEGTAIVVCTVNVDGTTSDCSVASVTGSALFGQAALEFVRSHRFRPATHNGVATATRAQMPFKFKLD